MLCFFLLHRVDLWLLWCVFFFGLAWYLNHFHRHRVEHMFYCLPGGRLCQWFHHSSSGRSSGTGTAGGERGDLSVEDDVKDRLLTRLITE